MKRFLIVVPILLLAAAAVPTVSRSHNDRDKNRFEASLRGANEVPQTISTVGRGRLELKIDEDAQEIEYELTYDHLEGVAPFFTNPDGTPGVVIQAHIHFGSSFTAGGISAFLCGNTNTGPCPAQPGTVTGVIDPADVIGPAGQGIEAASFAELVRAIKGGNAYGNVHTSRWPGGEIRGQILRRH
jgi:hypothetical protein